MPLTICEINLMLTWSLTFAGRFPIIDIKLYVPVVALSTQYNTKLPQQLKSGFQRTTNWNKYQSFPKAYAQNRYLNHSFDPSFQGVNRFFVFSLSSTNSFIIFPPNSSLKRSITFLSLPVKSGLLSFLL